MKRLTLATFAVAAVLGLGAALPVWAVGPGSGGPLWGMATEASTAAAPPGRYAQDAIQMSLLGLTAASAVVVVVLTGVRWPGGTGPRPLVVLQPRAFQFFQRRRGRRPLLYGE